MQNNIGKAILSNLEVELKDLEAKNLENEDTRHSEHTTYNVDEHQSSEGENQDPPLPLSWKSTVS